MTEQVELLFLDDAPGSCQDLVEALTAQGYIVYRATNYTVAAQHMKKRNIRLLVHGTLRAKTHWETCDLLLAEHPDLPVLHARAPYACLEHGYHGTRVSGEYHILTSLKKFLAQVERLLSLSGIHQQESYRQARADKLDYWSKQFNSPDFAATFETSARCLSEELAAAAIMWIPGGDFLDFLQNAPAEESLLLAQRTRLCEGVHVWPSRDHLHWTSLLAEWRRSFGRIPGLEPNQPQAAKRGDTSDVVLPLSHLREGRVMGQLVLVGAVGWNSFVDDQLMSGLVQQLQKQWSYCCDFDKSNEQVFLDDLTSLYNQRYLPVALEQEVHRSQRSGDPFSILFLDVDYFKQVNDSFGHLVGSRVLIEMGHLVKKNLRLTDYGFRYGGDEFVIILSGADGAGARFLAERLRKLVENTEFDVLGHKVKVTISVGLATYPHSAKSITEVLWMADQAMYSSKNRGRNQVYSAS